MEVPASFVVDVVDLFVYNRYNTSKDTYHYIRKSDRQMSRARRCGGDN